MSFRHRVQYTLLSVLCAGTVGALGTMIYLKKQGSPLRVQVEIERGGEADIFSAMDKKIREWNEEYHKERNRRANEKR